MQPLAEVLAERSYPGRGVLLARTVTGELALAYFLTGRSRSSRRRQLQVSANGDVAVVDTSGTGQHDVLRHYIAAARRGHWTVVGNGEQVVPLAEALHADTPLWHAWQAHTYEPDPPLFTSRIWVARRLLDPAEEVPGVDGVFGVARRSGRGDDSTDRIIWAVDSLAVGTGVLMTTYDGDVDVVRSTASPVDVDLKASSVQDVLEQVWSALNPALRVAAFVLAADQPDAHPMLRIEQP